MFEIKPTPEINLPVVGYVVLADGVDMTHIHTPVNAWLVAMASAIVKGTTEHLPWIVPVVSTEGWITEAP